MVAIDGDFGLRFRIVHRVASSRRLARHELKSDGIDAFNPLKSCHSQDHRVSQPAIDGH